MGSAKKIFDGIKWTYLNVVISSVYGFVSVPLLLNYFGKVNFGLIALSLTFNAYLGLMDLGIAGTAVRYFSTWISENNKQKVKELFETTFFSLSVIGIINALILIVFCFFCDRIFDLTTEQVTTLRWLIGVLSVNAIISWSMSPFDQIIRSGEHVAWLQKRALIPIIAQIVILTCTLLFKWSLPVYFALIMMTGLLIMPITIHKIRCLYPYVSFVPRFNRPIFKEILAYSLSIFSFGFFQFSMLNLRPVILGVQSTIESVADYKVLSGIIGMVLTVSSSFFGVMLPSSVKAVAQGNMEAQYRIIYDGTRYVTMVLSLFIFGGVVVGDSLLRVYVGDSFAQLSIWLSIWLLSLFVMHNQAISTIVFANTNLKSVAYMSAFSTLVGLTISWFLSPKYMVGGVVIGYFVYCLTQTLFYYLYYWPRVLHISSWRVFWYCFFPPFICGFIAASVCLFLLRYVQMKPVITFFAAGSTYVILYVVLSSVISLRRRDYDFALRLIKR